MRPRSDTPGMTRLAGKWHSHALCIYDGIGNNEFRCLSVSFVFLDDEFPTNLFPSCFFAHDDTYHPIIVHNWTIPGLPYKPNVHDTLVSRSERPFVPCRLRKELYN